MDAALYCFDCEGEEEHPHFGYMLMLASLAEVVDAANTHDESHDVTVVDESSCGFGMW